MMVQRKLLWIDGLAALVAGVLVLLSVSWLSEWYRLSSNLLFLIGVVNLIYASYSLTLASRARRPKFFILLLIFANFMWVTICLYLAFTVLGSASLLGLTHLVGEALFVGGLASLEWRWRELLQTA